jgi:hypothetical protein
MRGGGQHPTRQHSEQQSGSALAGQGGACRQGSGDRAQHGVQEIPEVVNDGEFLRQHFAERQHPQDNDGFVRNQPLETRRQAHRVREAREQSQQEKRQIGIHAA